MKIKEGMNIACHPAISKKGTAGICDNYIVNKTGVSECLHKMPKEIFIVGMGILWTVDEKKGLEERQTPVI